jgi:hypothetical protein
MPYSPLKVNWWFRGIYRLRHQGWSRKPVWRQVESWLSMDYMALYPTREYSELFLFVHCFLILFLWWSVTIASAMDDRGEEMENICWMITEVGMNSIYLALALQLFDGPWPLFSFLILYRVGRTPWTGNLPVARPLPILKTTQRQNKYTGIYDPSVWMGFEPMILVFRRREFMPVIGGGWITGRKLVPRATLSTTNPTWILTYNQGVISWDLTVDGMALKVCWQPGHM